MKIVNIGFKFELDFNSTASAFRVGVTETVGVGRIEVSTAVGDAVAVAVGTGWVAAFWINNFWFG